MSVDANAYIAPLDQVLKTVTATQTAKVAEAADLIHASLR
ncbi:MAG: sugar isomerase, partial [Catenulispora sp.]|nr:sugar isomerase [Catenulispora sp.]